MWLEHPAGKPFLWLIASLVLFGWPGPAVAARSGPCSVELLKAMVDCGMSGYEADRVCHYATSYVRQNGAMSGAQALLKALRRLGLAQDLILEKISAVLFDDERVMIRLNARKRSIQEPSEGAEVKWELRSREGDPLSSPPDEDAQSSAPASSFSNPPWYKVDQHALFDEESSNPMDDLGEDLDLMLKLNIKF